MEAHNLFKVCVIIDHEKRIIYFYLDRIESMNDLIAKIEARVPVLRGADRRRIFFIGKEIIVEIVENVAFHR